MSAFAGLHQILLLHQIDSENTEREYPLQAIGSFDAEFTLSQCAHGRKHPRHGKALQRFVTVNCLFRVCCVKRVRFAWFRLFVVGIENQQ